MEYRYMIWNNLQKEYQFPSICETTEKGANTLLFKKIGNDEEVIYIDGMIFEVREHYYNNKLIAYNLVMEEELIESYDEAEIAIVAMKEVLTRIYNKSKYIDMEKVNLVIEA